MVRCPLLVLLHRAFLCTCTNPVVTPRSGLEGTIPRPGYVLSPDKNQATSVLGKQACFLSVTEQKTLTRFFLSCAELGRWHRGEESFCFYFYQLKPQPSVSFTALHRPLQAQYRFPAPSCRSVIINVLLHWQVMTAPEGGRGQRCPKPGQLLGEWVPLLQPWLLAAGCHRRHRPVCSAASRPRAGGEGPAWVLLVVPGEAISENAQSVAAGSLLALHPIFVLIVSPIFVLVVSPVQILPPWGRVESSRNCRTCVPRCHGRDTVLGDGILLC